MRIFIIKKVFVYFFKNISVSYKNIKNYNFVSKKSKKKKKEIQLS